MSPVAIHLIPRVIPQPGQFICRMAVIGHFQGKTPSMDNNNAIIPVSARIIALL